MPAEIVEEAARKQQEHDHAIDAARKGSEQSVDDGDPNATYYVFGDDPNASYYEIEEDE